MKAEGDQALAWVLRATGPEGPLQLLDAHGRSWQAVPGTAGKLVLLETFSPKPGPKPGLRPVPVAARARNYAVTAQPPRYERPLLQSTGWTYVPLRKLGEGSFGQVYLGRRQDGLLVALKYAQPQAARELAHEAAVMQAVRHGCLLRCLDIFRPPWRPASLVLPLAVGTLAALLGGPVEPRRTLHALDSVHRGLNALHAVGYVHLDVSPRNVLLLPKGRVQLADFGGAQREGEELHHLYAGARAYRSPELLLGARRVHRGMDQWALGAVARELALRSSGCVRGDHAIERLVEVVALLGSPSARQLAAMLPGWAPELAGLSAHDFDAAAAPPAQRPQWVLDAGAQTLSELLLHYDPGERAVGWSLWPRAVSVLRARLKGPPAVPASSARKSCCGGRRPRRGA